ncbi:MAG: hypothetical protein QGF94_04670 [Candidatus Thalassarchaeaceae archaeon]|nr:hypothetical protein [Candidatus Thalassarchaeaceae archaeon]
MTKIDRYLENIGMWRKTSWSLIMVSMMILSTLAGMSVAFTDASESDWNDSVKRTAVQTGDQYDQPYRETVNRGDVASPFTHPALMDPAYGDYGVMYGKVSDLSLLNLRADGWTLHLEERIGDDHDNDGIDDLNDLDDDNDGIYDLIERFDGCFGTGPLDHDNDGISDEDDWDDDNDGILEGPLDMSQGADPLNVSTDRYVMPNSTHPWNGELIPIGYLVDQNPWDHDNDGVPDEDFDGSGPGSYDEDDDNDGQIDQFTWPCDFDGDGQQDYFDSDDDDDGITDRLDANPYDASNTNTVSYSYTTWTLSQYSQYSGGVDFVALEAMYHPSPMATPTFTAIHDGDFDGDLIPNFLDPDDDNDGLPDNADTDDDNDGMLDMWDPDDDNDGILDACTNVDYNNDGLNDLFGGNTAPYQVAGADGDNDGIIDCEMDYDRDKDDDRWRAIDQNYNGIWDWFDSDMGGNVSPDNPNGQPSWDVTDFAWDIDNDGTENELDRYPTTPTAIVNTWNCLTVNPDPRCDTERASFAGFNDWDGDGIDNWKDSDDDGDGIIDWLDIDPDCDFDNDDDIHQINGSKYRDDGPNDVDSDIDGDGLDNSVDWDDDNDGINDLYDPDDGNCGFVDTDANDQFYQSYYPVSDGNAIDGSNDNQEYQDNSSDHWNITYLMNPFDSIVIDYNGYDGTTNPPVSGEVPEFYWYVLARWSPWSGGNDVDIDIDGDSLQNGLDVDQDGDGLPDWWDQDEGNDGLIDINDFKFGGTVTNSNECGWTSELGYVCGWNYAVKYMIPLETSSTGFNLPFSTRPDPTYTDGTYDGANSANNWRCTSSSCYQIPFNGQTVAAFNYSQMAHNRDLYITWVGLSTGMWNWNADINGNFFPDESLADLIPDDTDPDDDCGNIVVTDGQNTYAPTCQFNDTADLDDDLDGVYDLFDVDDDNDGIWDYLEVDSDGDWDDDANTQPPGNFFTGFNCDDNDDDGTDSDPDNDGWYQAVWDQGVMGQGLLFPEFYDVDNDNDGVPDGEDFDDDNDGILDVDQELQCFWGEEQSTWDHDNDGTLNWADDDWDGDGISNTEEANGVNPLTAPWDHDNDGLRDDVDLDDDSDGMHDEDEIILWPTRYGRNSTNPWDHDDFGNGEALSDPSNPYTGPDVRDLDDDNDTREDTDYDILEEGHTAFCNGANVTSSDWDHDNDCVLDEDDKIPTRVELLAPDTLWLDAQFPAILAGTVYALNFTTGNFTPTGDLPVQVHVAWVQNGTEAFETINVLSNQWGAFSVGQFLFPENIHVGDNTTYEIWAEVTEMFIHDGSESPKYPVAVNANLTLDYTAWTYFRSDEQPLWLDFKTHYEADWDRGIFDKRMAFAPITFSISGGPFGNRTTPTNYTGFGQGFRADEGGWTSLTYVQQSGAVGDWKQVRYNSTMDNGPGMLPGGYEEVVWNNLSLTHDVVGTYTYSNTSLPVGDYEVTGHVVPSLAGYEDHQQSLGLTGAQWPWPYVHGAETDTFSIRSMHRMYVEAEIIVAASNPVYYYDMTQFTGSSYGAWRALFSSQGLSAAGLTYEEAKLGKPFAQLWDGNPASLTDEAAKLRPFLRANSSHWFIIMQNGGDFDVPPCGQIDPSDPQSPLRCEIIPEMNTGETFRVIGNVTNRTGTPWLQDPMALQVDLDHNGIFQGSQETGYARVPTMYGGEARFDYNWTWYSQYQASTYGVRVDFTNSEFYFTGNLTNVLAPTGAYGNISVVGTTDFQLNTLPRLYRNQNTTVEARLVDNALQPVRSAPVNWTWSANGESNFSETDQNGVFKIDLNISEFHQLGNFSLQFSFPGNSLLKGSMVNQEMWVVSRTYIELISTTPNMRSSGEVWQFTAAVTDDNRTPALRDSGQALDGNGSDGGTVQVIFEGTDFDNVQHRQVMFELDPNFGAIYSEMLLDAQILREDPESFLPNGFGPVNVILRFEENLPHEGCEELQIPYHLSLQGAWDPCASVQGSDHYRRVMQHNVDGFSLIGRTTLDVDDQIVYTSEVDPITGENVEKPMVVTGQLVDELGGNLSNRAIRVSYEMQGGVQGVVSCQPGSTDFDGYFDVTCPLDDVMAGQARVTVEFNAYENNDRFRYMNASVTRLFPVFSNSTLHISEVGPFKTDVDRYEFVNGTSFPVLYLKESYHIHALLEQSNGNPLGGKCLNIYLDPQQNTRPVATAITADENGEIEWFSGDKDQNPSRKGIEPNGNKLEGFRILRVAYEPDIEVPGGCRSEANAVVNGTYMDMVVLVRSRIDMVVKVPWTSPSGYLVYDDEKNCATPEYEGNHPCVVHGSIAILRDRIDLAVEDQTVTYLFQYLDENDTWVTHEIRYIRTDEQGVASFSWNNPGEDIPGELPCEQGVTPCATRGEWRITAMFEGSDMFQEYAESRSLIITQGEAESAADAGWTLAVLLPIIIAFLFACIIGAVMYKRYSERRRIEILRGILTDSLMALQARNEYIQVIFNCYKDLVRFFRQHGFMKKVYETTREFEWAVRKAFYMVPSDQLDDFLSIFEEARYSDHDIGIAQRDKVMSTLTSITQSISMALGDSMITRTAEHDASLHGNLTKAGEFVDSEGNVQQAGLDESQDAGFSL